MAEAESAAGIGLVNKVPTLAISLWNFSCKKILQQLICGNFFKLGCGPMSMSVTVDNVSSLMDNGVWCCELAPNAVQRLGTGRHSIGEKSVLLIIDPLYQSEKRELRFRLENTTILNVGTTDQTILLSAGSAKLGLASEGSASFDKATDATDARRIGNYGLGDRKFLVSLRELPVSVQQIGQEFLSRVRQKYAGDLKPYPHRRFINQPDNFWGVQIQIRKKMLKISVRGTPEQLPTTGLRVWLDRPPIYSAFKIEDMSQVADAIQIIDHADRK